MVSTLLQTLLVNFADKPDPYLFTFDRQTLFGHPVSWVDNQFRQYVFNITDLILSSDNQKGGTNITFSFESAFYYGRNVSARPDAETFPGKNGDVLRFLFQVANNLFS